ncbi:MFS transporter [uncultured Maritalea sp.]|uniref:MFS transporter n=1 Tax=uncultured Maritalea sp. TaxID=757249 RepID=UPI00262BA860|nr:MFS transporter [uncultured Maritalea sp.]
MSAPTQRPPDHFNKLFSKEFILLSMLNILIVGSHAVNSYVTVTIVPSIVVDLGGREYMFWLFALFQVGSIVAGVVAGSYKNKIGARNIFSIACLILLFGSLLGGMANHLTLVILGRGLQGIGEGMLLSLIYILVADLLPSKLLPRMFALSSVIWSVAAASGPLFAGVMDQFISWRAAFLFNVPLVLILLAIAWRAIPKQEAKKQADPLPIKRLVLLTVGLLVMGAAGQFTTPAILAVIIVTSLAMLAGFMWLDNKATNRLLPARPFTQDTAVSICMTMIFLIPLAASAGNVYFASLLRSVWDLSALQAGYALAIIAFAWTTVAWLTNKIDDPIIEFRMIQLGSFSYAVGMAISAAGLYFGSLGIVCFGFAVQGAAMGASSQFNRKVIITRASQSERSTTSGAIAPTSFTGAVIGAALAGLTAQMFGLFEGTPTSSVFDPDIARTSGSMMMLVFAGLAFCANLISLRLRQRHLAAPIQI